MPRNEGMTTDFDIARANIAEWPPEQQMALATQLVEVFVTNAKQREKPDLSSTPLWRGKVKEGPALAYIEKHYGTHEQLLEKGIYREDIKGHDPRLIHRASDEARNRHGKPLRDFVPNQSDEIDKIAIPLGFDKNGYAVSGMAIAFQKIEGAMANRRQRERQKSASSGPRPLPKG